MKASEVRPGVKIYRFTVDSFSHKDDRHRKWWNCICECGVRKVVHGSSMVGGNTRSCGCLSKESKAKTRKPNNGSELTAVILGYKRHAKARGLEWRLSRDDVRSIVLDNCIYCGVGPSNTKITKNTVTPFRYNGIDRVDNSKGYLKENSAPCCNVCNRAKRDMELSDFMAWADRISKTADQWGNASAGIREAVRRTEEKQQ